MILTDHFGSLSDTVVRTGSFRILPDLLSNYP